MTLPLSPEELKDYNNVPTTPQSQKLGDTINDLVAGSAYQVANMAARNALTPEPNQVVRVESTGELFVWDASTPQWRVVPNSSTRPDFFKVTLNGAESLTLWVDPAGSDVNGEGTQASPFATVARALENIPNGFYAVVTIAVAPGTYPDVVWQMPIPGVKTEGSPFSNSPFIRIAGQVYAGAEVITLASGNLTASTVPHPSGLGNYASFRSFNSFPTWSTPIPGTFPTVYPVAQQGTPPEYMLIRTATLNSGASFSIVGNVVLPGSDNTTGSMRLLTTSLFSTGDYYLVNKTAFPSFPSLYKVDGQISPNRRPLADLSALSFAAGNTSFAACDVEVCFFDNSFFVEFANANVAYSVFSRSVSLQPAVFMRSDQLYGFFENYVHSVSLRIAFGACAYVDRCIFDSTEFARPKLVVGGIFETNAAGSGDSASISYTGYVDMIGAGVGIRMGSASVSPYNNFTFDGVSNPLLLNSGSNWGRRGGSAIGTSTGPTIIGVNSSTGASDAGVPSGTGISTWNVQNTATPGQEVQVGNNPVTTYASLPQTDFALGNTSLGAIGR